MTATALSLPLFFEANRGQADSRVQFLARSGGYTLFVAPTETIFAETRNAFPGAPLGKARTSKLKGGPPAILRMKLVNGNPLPLLSGANELPGKVNYLIGKNPSGWHVGVPIYAEVHSAEVYPGIDLLFYGNQNLLEYDFRVSPGADPGSIQFRVSGAQKMRLDENGDLVLRTANNEFRMHKPLVYQEVGKDRQPVDGGFSLKNGNLVAFHVSSYNKKLPLIIDPSVLFATFLGGTGEELPIAEDLDTTNANAPKLYVGGVTSNLGTFSEANTVLGVSPGAADYTFVAKIDPTTTGAASLDYLTFIGGSVVFSGGTGPCQNLGNYMQLDLSAGAGQVQPVLVGQTNCQDFPVTSGGPTASTEDLFLTRLTPSGAGIDNSIFFGGNGVEGLTAGWTASIALNPEGSVVIAGATTSTNLPTTTGAYSVSFNNGTPGIYNDCFVGEFDRSFSVQYLTYLNVGTGTTTSSAASCGVRAIDASGKIYAGGETYSATAFNAANGGTGANGFQKTFAGTAGTNENGFLVLMDPSQTGLNQLVYSTYLGGGGPTDIEDADVDISNGLVVVSGVTFANSTTAAPNIPLANAYQNTNTAPGGSGFVTLFDSTKTGAASLVASTYLGGSAGGGSNQANAVAFDRQSGNPPMLRLIVGGQTTASNFPTLNPLQASLVGTQNAFLSVMSVPNSGVTYPMTLLFSTYMGGGVTASGESERIHRVIADPNHNIYALGRSPSANFFGNTTPATTVNGFQTTCASCGGASPASDLVIFEVPPQGGASVPDLTITKTHSGNFMQGQANAQYTITVKNSGVGATTGVVTMVDTLPVGLTATGLSGTNWNCTVANLTCTRSDSLGAGASYDVITLTVNVSATAPAIVTNIAVVSGGNETNTSNDTAADVTTITTTVGGCTDNYIGVTNGSWGTATNWSTGAVPGATDVACIPSGITVLLNTGLPTANQTISGLNSSGTFTVSAGPLTVTGNAVANVVNISGGGLVANSQFTISGPVGMTGGTFAGTGEIDIGGLLTWSGGYICSTASGASCGSGTNATLNANAGISFPASANVNFWNRTLNLTGTATWSGANGLMSMATGAVINVPVGSVWNYTNDSYIQSSGTTAFNNAGTFEKTPTGTATTTIGVPFNNTGTVLGNSGTISFTLGGNCGSYCPGTYTPGTGGTINFASGVFGQSGPINGTGTLNFNGGTMNFGSGIETISTTTVNMTGGVIGGAYPGVIDFEIPFNWSGGYICSVISGTGCGSGTNATMNANAGINFPASANVNFWNRTLNLTGTATWSGANGLMSMATGAVINVPVGSVWNYTNDSYIQSSGTTAFNNAGTFEKTPTGTATTTIGVPFNNTGTVLGNSGTISFTLGGNCGSYCPGAYTPGTGGTINFASGVFGQSGPINGTGTLNFNGATMNFGTGTEAISTATVNMTAGVLGGASPGILDFSTPFNWSGGYICSVISGTGCGSGTNATMNANAGINFPASANVNFWNRTLNLTGTATWSGANGLISLATGAVINVPAGATWLYENDSYIQSSGTTAFNNAGTLEKMSPGSGISVATTTLGVPFNNTGTVLGNSGTISFTLGGNCLSFCAGAYTPGTGGTINFASGVFGQSGPINGAGTVNFNGATMDFGTGTETISTATVNMTAGVLGGASPGVLNFSTPFNWSGGYICSVISGTGCGSGTNATMNANAGINFPASANVNFWNRTLNLTGTSTWSGANGLISLATGAAINIQSGATWNFANDSYIQGTGTVNNAGTFEKTGGTATSTVGVGFTNTGNVRATASTLYFSAGFTQTAGNTILNGGSLESTSANPLQVQAGNLSGSGTIMGNVSNTGDNLAPGTSATAGAIAISGTGLGMYTQGAAGSYTVKIGGTAAGQFDTLAVSGTAALNGVLTVSLINGFTPAAGNSFTILTAGTVSGTFASKNLPTLPAGLGWTVTYNAASVVLSVTGSSSPVLQSITVAPENALVAAGGTQQFTATGIFSDGSTQNLAGSVSWLSSNTSIATINSSSGLASGIVQGGPVRITATSTSNSSISGTASLSVAPPIGFTLTNSLNTARVLATGTLLTNGQVLVVGGEGAGSAGLGSAELYNPATGTFTATGNLNFPRIFPTATLLPNGSVLIAGGYASSGSGNAPVATAEIYNPTTGKFTSTGSLNTPRYGNTATLLNNGTVLFAGGFGPSNAILSSAEVYNPAAGTFTAIASMTMARFYHTATLLNNGNVLIAGGAGQSGSTLGAAEIYNPAAGTFTATGSLVSARYEHTATLLDDGTVLMAGGLELNLGSSTIYTPVLAAELYNPTAGTFAATGSNMTVGRTYDSANLLNNGTVLFAGGILYNSDGTYISLPSAEIYDPVAKTFTATGSMNTERAGQAGVRLLNGNVLEAGGAIVEDASITTTATTTPLSSAELYTPTSLTQPGLSSITVTPAAPSIPAGTSQKFTATGTFTGGSQQTLASVTWTSSSPGNVTITNDATDSGSGFGVLSGSATITACEGSVCGSTSPAVTATLQSIAVTPASPTIAQGATQQFTATGSYSDGSQKNITSQVAWSSGTITVATINAAGLATGVGGGTSKIIATLGSVSSPADTLTVTGVTLQSIAVTPTSPSIAKGLTQQFTAIGNYSDGSQQNLTSQVTWNSATTGVATISASGLAVGVGVGTSNITANLNGVTSPIDVLTVTAPALLAILVTPEVPTVAAGQTVQFTATATFTDGSTSPTGVNWTSSNTTIAIINSTGLASAIQQGGPIAIKATSTSNAAIFGTAALSVAPPVGFQMTGGLNTARTGQGAVVLTDGRVLTAGGATSTATTLASAEIYDPATGTFGSTGTMTTPRIGQAMILLPNGKVLAEGGAGSLNAQFQVTSYLSSAELYDPSNGTFTATGSLTTVRWGSVATLLNDGTVLISGGKNSAGTVLASAEVYNPATGMFTLVGTMTTPRSGHTSILLDDGTVIICGGSNGTTTLSSAEVYNPTTKTFTSVGSMTIPRSFQTSTLLDDGTVLYTGGLDSSSNSLSFAELYNPATQTFSATGSMSVARWNDTATLLNNGTVLIAGGALAGNGGATSLILPSAEIYDPVSKTFSQTGSLNIGREGQYANRLLNGNVLVSGGDNIQYDSITVSGGALGSAETYTPSSLTQPGLTSITLTPVNASIPFGTFQKYTAMGNFTGGTQQTLASATWSSSNPAEVSITNDDLSDIGRAFAHTSGNVIITACEGAICGSTSMQATATLQSIAISPSAPSIPKGLTQQFTAIGSYSDGSQQNITSQVTWNSATTGVATVSATGLATGVGAGTSNITARLSGVTSPIDTLTVTAATLQTIAVTPANPSIAKGLTQQFTATGLFSDGSMVNLTSQVTWASATTGVATINAAGLATAVNTGTSNITASLNGVTSLIDTLTVTGPAVVSITVLPPSTTLTVAGLQQYLAIGTFSDGSIQDLGGNVTWLSSNTTLATINSSGAAAGVKAGGPVTITATSTANPAVSGTAQLNISGATPFAYVGDVVSANCCLDVINTSTNQIIKTIPITNINEPLGITPDQSRVYIADNVDNLVDVIDTTTNTLMTTIPIGVDPTSVAITPDGKFGYVADFGDNNLNVFNVATNAAVTSIPIGFPAGAASITPDGAWVYASSVSDARVALVSTATNTLSTTFSLTAPAGQPAPGCAIAPVFNPAGTLGYFMQSACNTTSAIPGTVNVLSIPNNTLVATITVGLFPFQAAISPDGSRLYVANAVSNTVSVINTATNTVIATIPVAKGPQSIAVTPDGAHVYVASSPGTTIPVIQASTNTVTTNIQATVPFGIVIASPPPASAATTLTLTPPNLIFNSQLQGTTSAAQTIVVKNPGATPVTLTNVSLTGPNTGAFLLTNLCPAAPLTLGAGATCNLQMRFAASSVAQFTALISIANNNGTAVSTQSVPLSGTGVSLSSIALSPASPSIAQGATQPFTATATFSDGSTANITSQVTWNSATTTVATINSAGVATGVGPGTSNITASLSGVTSPADVLTVTLAVLIPGASVTPPSLTFPSQVIGTPGTPQPVSVNSTGTGPLAISNIALTGANPSEYSETNVNCPIFPATLPAGMSCTIEVSFAPLAVGTRTANLVVTDNNNNIPGSQQSVSLTGTSTAPAPSTTTVQLPFTPGTNVSQVAVVNCPSGTSPCTDPNAHSMKILFSQVNTPFVLTVTATEVPISQANGVCLAGNNETNDFDCRFTEFFPIQTEANGNIIVPECIPYSNGNCVFYRITNAPNVDQYSGPVFENIAWNNTAFVPPSFYQANNPQAYDDPDYAPYNVNHQFALDVTDYFNPVAQVGTDPTLTLHTTRFSDFTVAWPGSLPSPAYTFTFQPPLNGTPSVAQGATIPVAFALSQNGTPVTSATTAPNTVSIGLTNAQGIRQPAYAPGGAAAAFVYNSTAQLYQLTLATQNLVPGTYTLLVNSNLFTQQTATITITAVPLQTLTTSPLVSGAQGVLYAQPFTAVGGTAPYTWAITSGSLPNGLTLSSAGFLNGMPTVTGTFTFTVRVTDSAQNSVSAVYSLTVNIPVAGAGVSPSNLTYPTQVIGTTSAAQTVTVNSTGTGPLTISSIGFTGADPTEYSEIDNCPISPVYLPAGMSCTIQVSFAPLAVGTRTANLVVTDNNNNIPGSQQSVSLTGTATAPAPTVTTVQLPFTPGTKVSQVAVVNCPSGTSPCTDPNAHSMKILFSQVNTPFVLTVTATEVPISQANGVCEAGNNEDNDFDCRFTEYFPIQTEANGDIIVPQCIPYSNGNCVFYTVSNAPATTAYSGPVFENIAWNNTAFVPPSFYQHNNPQAYDHPGYAPYTVNNQFALDVTDYFNPVAQVGTDPTLTLHTTRFSDFTAAWPGSLPSPAYTFTFQPPLNGTPSVAQGASIPVAFALTQNGTPITNATTAPNIVSLGIINAQGIRQPAYAPGGAAAAFVYNSTAQLYQLTLATQNLVPGTYTLLVNSNLFTQQTATFTITAVPLQILTTSPLPGGTVGVLYPLAFTAIGGTAPYTWMITSGALPNGLTLSTAGFLDGTPTATGTSSFTVQVKDSAQNSQSTTYSLTIAPPVLVSIAVTPANPSITQGTTQQFTATGTYTDGSTKNLTSSVTWTSSATAIASISATGLATGVSPGASNISAILGNVTSPLTTLTVLAPPQGVNLSATLVSSTTDASGNYIFTIRITNSGGATASAATVKTATLTTVAGTTRLTTNTTTPLPANLGNIAPSSSVTTTLTFPASAGSANSTGAISLGLGFTGGTASSVLKATLP